MFQSLRKPPKTFSVDDGTPCDVIPIARTEGGSVSAIRHFVFGGGDKGTEGRKFNSLSSHWRRRGTDGDVLPAKIKSPSFRTPKRHFFPSWSKTCSRYTSTPDLNKGNQDKDTESGNQEKFSGRPSVKKMVQELESTSAKGHYFDLPSPSKSVSKSIHSLKIDADNEHECFFSPPCNPHLSKKTNESVHSSIKRAVSLNEMKEGKTSGDSPCGVSNPLYSEIPSISNHDFISYSIACNGSGGVKPVFGDASESVYPNNGRESILKTMKRTQTDGRASRDHVSMDYNVMKWISDAHLDIDAPINNDFEPLPSEMGFSDSIFESLDRKFGFGHTTGFQSSFLQSSSSGDVFSSEEETVESDSCRFEYPMLETPLSASEVETETEGEVHSNKTKVEKTVVIQEPGRFLARWVPVEDLSSRDCDSPTEASGGTGVGNATAGTGSDSGTGSTNTTCPKEGKARRPAERRESGRFQSAARILRSFGRSRDEDGRKTSGGAGVGGGARPSRAKPHYQSEGKGNKKKQSDREPGAGTQKERSRSFCDKPDSKKRFMQQEENRLHRQEAKVQLDRKEKEAHNQTAPSILDHRSSLPTYPDPPSEVSREGQENEGRNQINCDIATSIEKEQNSVAVWRKEPLSPKDQANPSDAAESPEGGEEEDCDPFALERDRERKSARKLTKDSGYETSPYSEGDYANLDLISAEGAAPKAVDNGDAEATAVRKMGTTPSSSDVNTSERVSPEEDVQGSLAIGVALDESTSDPSAASESTDKPHSAFASSSLQRFPSAESLATFADSLVVSLPSSSPPSALVPARSTPSLTHDADCVPSEQGSGETESRGVNGALHTSKSTPNLEDSVDDDIMVTKKLSMYSYLQGSSPSSGKRGVNAGRGSEKRYWDPVTGHEDTFNQTDYAHHLRSSSYHILHSRQLSTGSYHSRQPSNTSNYSEGDEVSSRGDINSPQNLQHQSHNLMDRSRCFSFDSLGIDPSNHSVPWNISEPDLTLAPPLASSSFSYSQKYEKGQISPSPPAVPLTSSKKSPPTNVAKLPSSPPPPPVRDASSLKYIRYGPGHEKFPSWPVPAGATSLVLPQAHQNPHDANVSGLPDASGPFLSPPQGSHRSHSWTEQSEYPKEKCAGYARPSLKRQFSPSFQKQLLTVMEKCEKISPEVFKSRGPDDILRGPSFSLIDSYLQQSTYYPPFDREGRGIDDKDYSIPSPPERDPGMGGEAHLSQVTAAQLEEHARRCDVAYGDYPHGDFPQITPLLDQLRQESYTWDGASERDSGRGESESLTDSRYSNGRESVTTVVTNSSSASSSETLKWHGSLSDVSIMSGQSKEAKGDHNIVHSARVQPPQRQNSESVFYYGLNGRGKHHHPSKSYDSRQGREGCYPRPFRDGKWNREVERNNEVNNLKKFPSYSYTQPLSQISEAPLAESREALPLTARSPKSPTIDFSKPPSVAERINELERQSRSTITSDGSVRWPRDHSEPRDVRRYREDHQREGNLSLDFAACSELRKNSSERDLRLEMVHSRSDSNGEFKSPSSGVGAFHSPSSSVGSRYLRSSGRRDSEDSVLSSDSSLLSFGEHDRSSASSTSYTYLDPNKRCKVPDATLKSIQKQALLSFYVRRTGKSFNAGSSSSSHTSPTSPVTPPGSGGDLLHPEWAGKSLRCERGGSRSGKGMARLGRVPDSEKGGGGSKNERAAAKPLRRRSVSGREASDDVTREVTSRVELPPLLPAKLQPSSVSLLHSSSSQGDDDNIEAVSEDERRSSLSRVCHDLPSSPPSASSSLKGDLKGDPSNQSVPGEALPPSLPPPADETPPKPPDRPPKKPNLRSLFHPPSDTPLEETSSPSRTYFYKKPPAPDPPLTPPDSPPPSTLQSPPSSGVSRSSTPELPPPPPPPVAEEGEVVVSDEPLPPPPTPSEVPPENTPAVVPCGPASGMEDENAPQKSTPIKAFCNGTYHKDSYMAHRKDWKTGYEGRYRRTHSPTASDRNSLNGRNRDQLNNNINTLKSSQPLSKASLCKPPAPIHTNGNLRSAVSTSSLLQRPTSPIDKESLTNDNHVNINSNNNNNNCTNNGWTPHARQKSTTVNFTAEELRAFKARRAAQEGFLSSTGELRGEISPLDGPHLPLRPLSRAFSLGEPLHIQRFEDDSSEKLSRASFSVNGDPTPPAPLPHDGPVTAHPATVTEEATPPLNSPKGPPSLTLLPPTSLSENFANSHSSILRTSSASLSPSTSPVASSVNSSTTSLSSSSSTLVSSSLSSSTQSISSTSPSLPTTSTTVTAFVTTTTTSSSTSSLSSSLSLPLTATTTTSTNRRPDYGRSLSSTGTCPSMTLPNLLPEELADRANIVVLTYGRTPKAEVIDCERLSEEFVEKGNIDSRLQALLAPRPPYKSMANYMDGVFTLEMRKDLLRDNHANHPDFHSLTLNICESQNGSSENSLSTINGNSENTRKHEPRNNVRAPLPADSAYFTTSESKAKLLSRIRDSSSHNEADSPKMDTQCLKKQKEELIKSISRKLEILKGEQLAIREEMSLNSDLGLQVTARVEMRAKAPESDKYKLHVEEIDKITSLLLGLSGRLARAENALLLIKEETLPEERRILKGKRDKLSEQLEEAKKLKENIDRRAVQVSRILTQYLTEEEYADYDHFIKMKAKLIMDSREIDDKIKLGEEQLQALANTLPNL